MDKVSFFEQALGQIGCSSYADGSESAKALELYYPGVIAEALMYGSWSFATRSAELLPNVERPGFYAIPEDCLRLLAVDSQRFSVEGREIIVGQRRFPSEEKLKIRYISSTIASTEYLPASQPLFVQAVSTLLASRIAPAISGRHDLAASLLSKYRMEISKALHMDVIQQSSNDQKPHSEKPWGV